MNEQELTTYVQPFQNWLKIKPLLEKDTDLIQKLKDTISNNDFVNSSNYLGSGETNIIFSIGSIQVESKQYDLAFRTAHGVFGGDFGHGKYAIQHDIARFDQVAEQTAQRDYSFGGFIRDYVKSQDFFGMVQWGNDDEEKWCHDFGLIVQDLTSQGKYYLEGHDYETATVLEELKGKNLEDWEKKKEIGTYFVDPLYSANREEERAKKYFETALYLGNVLK